MDLLKLFKESLRNPFSFKSLTIIFVNLFFVAIIALSMLYILGLFGIDFSPAQACNSNLVKKLTDSVGKNNDVVYNFNFRGNSYCFLNTYVTWKNPNDAVTFWIYDPKGNVNVVDPNPKQAYNFVYVPSPVATGNWKFVLKTESSRVNFNGEISFH